MKKIVEESLIDIQSQIEEVKAKFNQLLGAESVLKLILEEQNKIEKEEATKELESPKKSKNG